MGPGCKIYALKRIKLAGRDEEAASGFIDEINLLNSLKDKPNIIQLVESQVRPDCLNYTAQPAQHMCPAWSSDKLLIAVSHQRIAKPGTRHAVAVPAQCVGIHGLGNPGVCWDSALLCATCVQVFTEEGLIYMVQEYGEIDLARLLAKHDASRKEAGALKDNIDENFIRLYWQQMLQVCCACLGATATTADMGRFRALLLGLGYTCRMQACRSVLATVQLHEVLCVIPAGCCWRARAAHCAQ
jgi:serine/threonine protein kinase